MYVQLFGSAGLLPIRAPSFHPCATGTSRSPCYLRTLRLGVLCVVLLPFAVLFTAVGGVVRSYPDYSDHRLPWDHSETFAMCTGVPYLLALTRLCSQVY